MICIFFKKYLHSKSIPILDFIYHLYFEYSAWLTVLIKQKIMTKVDGRQKII